MTKDEESDARTRSIVDLVSVSASELARQLLKDRFGGTDEMAATEFLLEAVSTLPNAESTSEQLLAREQADEDDEAEQQEDVVDEAEVEAEVAGDARNAALGASLLVSDSIEISCIQPRSKFDVSYRERGMQFVDKKGESFTVLPHVVQHVIFFPKPEDCRLSIKNAKSKKNISDMVLLVLKDDTVSSSLYKNKALKQVCLQLPVEVPVWKNEGSDSSEAKKSATRTASEQDPTDSWMQVLAESLDFVAENMTRVYNPAMSNTASSSKTKNAFASHTDNATSTTVSGLPFVSCYLGVNDGVLFPAEAGLLFFKPPRFLPRGTLHSIDCTGSNRYVTLTVVATDSQEVIEFTNIHKQEQGVLKKYIHGTLIPAMQRDLDDNDVSGEKSLNQDDEDEEDEVIVVSSNRKKRKAAAEAAVVNKRAPLEEEEDDDDDDDYAEAADDDDDENASGSDNDDEEEEDDDASGGGISGDEQNDDNDYAQEATESEDEDD